MTSTDVHARRHRRDVGRAPRKPYQRVLPAFGLISLVLVVLFALWVAFLAFAVKTELGSAQRLSSVAKDQIAANDIQGSIDTFFVISHHLSTSRETVEEPVWRLASMMPWIGPNFRAVSELVLAADDIAEASVQPMLSLYNRADLGSMMPSRSGTNILGIEKLVEHMAAPAQQLNTSAEKIASIETNGLLPFIAQPLADVQNQVGALNEGTKLVRDAMAAVPDALGKESPRNYLLMIQNNSETRATGGIPGAVAVLTLDKGAVSLGQHSNAGTLGIMSPPISADLEQEQIYSKRLGKYLQDVTLTPDFPTSASLATQMWERHNGQRLDGVLSIDPVALSFILEASGPLQMNPDSLPGLVNSGLPSELTSGNVVATLLADVYQKVEEPTIQDAYFAAVASAAFESLSEGTVEVKPLSAALSKAAAEKRLLLWSRLPSEQAVVGKLNLSGSAAVPRDALEFGVYFNDGTGAKMDYYVKRKVQLIGHCPKNGYGQITVRVTSTNTAPADAATSLPAYVTGGGTFGVPPGSVQTNTVVYGPAQANVEAAMMDGIKKEFASHLHGARPVGIVAVRLAPGESRTVEFKFGKISPSQEPKLVVTPTIQSIQDVISPTQTASCS